MKYLLRAVLGLILFINVQARAALYDITFSYADNNISISANGLIQATPNGDGSYSAVSGSLSITEIPLGSPSIAGTYGLYANPNGTAASFSPSGFFIYDNQVFPSRVPYLDSNGLLFTGNNLEINLWGNGIGDTSYFTIYGNNGANYNGTATISAVPEPTTMIAGALLLLPFGASTMRIVRRKRVA